MSIPRNHHFVSQLHIKNFFNNNELNKIFVYDKISGNHYSKKTSKSLFSEKDLNTKFENDQEDYKSLEKDLNDYFEKDFKKHTNTIQNFIEKLNYSEKVNNALYYFVKYGAIGELRNPRYKQSVDNTIYKVFNELSNNATPKLKNEIQEAITSKNKGNYYINSVQYSKFAKDIVKLMGDIIWIIEIPESPEDYYILPDFCAANRREKINTYFNPDVKEIAYIGFPLSSKIYLHFYSSKIRNNNNLSSDIFKVKTPIINEINLINLNYCHSKIACENQDYLKHFIKNVAQHKL